MCARLSHPLRRLLRHGSQFIDKFKETICRGLADMLNCVLLLPLLSLCGLISNISQFNYRNTCVPSTARGSPSNQPINVKDWQYENLLP